MTNFTAMADYQLNCAVMAPCSPQTGSMWMKAWELLTVELADVDWKKLLRVTGQSFIKPLADEGACGISLLQILSKV